MINRTRVRIAVSGVGGGVGQSILKALHGTDYEVVALDGEPLGTGLYAAPVSYVIPYANDARFVDRVIEICKKEDCKLFFPGLDAELPVLSEATDEFKKAGVQVVVSRPEVVALSDNKQLTYDELTKQGINVPKTIDMAGRDSEAPLPCPFILKKREGGARSKDVYLIKNEGEWSGIISSGIDLASFIAQEYIEGEEYTCGSINFDGQCMGVIVMRRILRDGDTYKCFVEKNDAIEAQVRKALEAIKPFGACNVQLRLKDGKPYVFEINSRCSGTTAARALCGFNEPKMVADYLCLGKKPAFKIKERAVLRYWQELEVATETIEEMRQKGSLKQDGFVNL